MNMEGICTTGFAANGFGIDIALLANAAIAVDARVTTGTTTITAIVACTVYVGQYCVYYDAQQTRD